MIEITRIKNENGENIGFRCFGHAGFARRGRDIVCSAASILAYTVAQTLTQMNKQGWLKKKPHLNLKEGKSVITCVPKAEFYEECLMVFFVAEMGYTLLAKSFAYTHFTITKRHFNFSFYL